VVSFVHIEALAIRYGQPRLGAWLLPVSIDGTVAVSSLTMLRSARAGLSSPWLARAGLILSVGATVACNVGYGLAAGLPGALLSGWPAVAFILSAEMAIGMSRRTRPAAHPARPAAVVPASRTRTTPRRRTQAAPVTETDAEAAFMDELASGVVPSIRQIRTRLRMGQGRAVQVQAHLRTLARTP
jgi:hypothetical protein